MTTHKERIRAAVSGEMPDAMPYVPRIDLWYNANSLAGTLPDKHKDRSRDEIALAEGWALFKMLPDMLDLRVRTTAILGLSDRGVIPEEGKADLLIIDPETIRGTATYAEPVVRAQGIDLVAVNGKIVRGQGSSRCVRSCPGANKN